MRLGCEVTAVDINPVAWFVQKCTLEYPQKLAGQKRPLPDFALQDVSFLTDYFKAHGLKAKDAEKRAQKVAGRVQAARHESQDMFGLPELGAQVQGSDVLQYIWGKLAGRHKEAPVLSPSKTWEGLMGGVASATALGAALYWITPFAPWQSALMAFVLCLMGFFGGLVMSAIKRDRGIKDWGAMIEGHGGMLDRVDSISFSAPIFFHIVRYWWT